MANSNLDEIKLGFSSFHNLTGLLEDSIESIKRSEGVTIQKNDQEFFNTLTSISTKIFEGESRFLSTKSIQEAVVFLNKTTIAEITRYISKKRKNNHKEFKTVKKILNIRETDTIVTLKNVKNIKVVSVDMYNEDYIINQRNNKFIFRLEIPDVVSGWTTIVIEPGNYTKEECLEELSFQLCKESGFKFSCYLDKITQKSVISLESVEDPVEHSFKSLKDLKETLTNKLECGTFEVKYTNFLDILGYPKQAHLQGSSFYISMYPMKLIKTRVVELKIYTNYSEESTCNFNHSLILKESPARYEIDSNLLLKVSSDITDFHVTFEDFKHNGFPFNIQLEIELIE